ncbi:MAG: hypothetical protein AB7L84_07945 [Acidimicrobiia bacterium]
MPVAKSQGHGGKALLVAAAGVAVAMAVAFLVAQAASRGDVEIRLGDSEFNAGQVENISKDIAQRGAPLLFPDLVGGDRHLYVQHLGDEPDEGWLAFGAFDPDDPSCLVDWSIDDRVFRNLCDESVTYPPDGTGLRYYDTTVEDGRLYVALNDPAG